MRKDKNANDHRSPKSEPSKAKAGSIHRAVSKSRGIRGGAAEIINGKVPPTTDNDESQNDMLTGGYNKRDPIVRSMAALYIEHPRFLATLRKIQEVVDTLYDVDEEPFCEHIGGPSGVGKSTLIRKLKDSYPHVREAASVEHPLLGRLLVDEIPVLFVKMPTQPTVISLGQAMLKSLGDPNSWRGGRGSVETRVDLLLDRCKVRAIVIDEAQRLADRNGTVTAFDVIDWLRDRACENNVILVLVGLGRMIELIIQDQQFARRYNNEIRLEPYIWQLNDGTDVKQDQEDFHGILLSVKKLSPVGIADDIDVDAKDDDIAILAVRRFHYASQGLLGNLFHLLKHAAHLVSKQEQANPTISLATLHAAFERGFNYKRKGMTNPFVPEWVPTNPPPPGDDREAINPNRRMRKSTRRTRKERVIRALRKR